MALVTRARTAGLLAVFCLASLPAGVAAVGTLDQSYEANTEYGLYSPPLAAQTFTAGKSGLLDTVALAGSGGGCPEGLTHTVQIRSVTSGHPTGGPGDTSGVLAQKANVACSEGFYNITFASPTTVVAGQQYAIVFGGTPSMTHDVVIDDGAYAGGGACTWSGETWSCLSGWDMHFRTYVTAVAKPDGRIRKGSGSFVGNNIYNATGTNQTKTGSAARGSTITFGIQAQNDGPNDSFRFAATGTATTKYTVTYFRGTTNITAAVVAGTYTTPALSPGATFLITAKVKVNSTATIGSIVTRLVTISSVADGTKKDAVKFTGKRS